MLSTRLKEIRKRRNISQVEMARAINVTQGTIANWETGKRTPDFDMVETIADYFNVSPAWLAGYTDDPTNYDDPDLIAEIPQAILEHFDGNVRKAYTAWKAADADYINEGLRDKKKATENGASANIVTEPSNISAVIPGHNIYRVPVFETVSAGFGAYASDEILDYIPVVIENAYDVDETIGLRVRGDSMEPKIEDGDTVVVRKQTSVDSGTIAVVLLDNEEGLVKKVVYGPTWIELHSFNPRYRVMRFDGAEVMRLRVVGKVLQIIKSL